MANKKNKEKKEKEKIKITGNDVKERMKECTNENSPPSSTNQNSSSLLLKNSPDITTPTMHILPPAAAPDITFVINPLTSPETVTLTLPPSEKIGPESSEVGSEGSCLKQAESPGATAGEPQASNITTSTPCTQQTGQSLVPVLRGVRGATPIKHYPTRTYDLRDRGSVSACAATAAPADTEPPSTAPAQPNQQYRSHSPIPEERDLIIDIDSEKLISPPTTLQEPLPASPNLPAVEEATADGLVEDKVEKLDPTIMLMTTQVEGDGETYDNPFITPLSKKEKKKVRLSLLMEEEQNNENKKAPTTHTNSMTKINTQTLNSRQKRLKRSAIQSDWIVMISEVPTGGSAGGKPRLQALSPSWDTLRIIAESNTILVEQHNSLTWKVGCPNFEVQSKIINYFLKHSTMDGIPVTARAPTIKVVGVVTGVPLNVDPNQFCANIQGDFPIREVIRLTKYSQQGNKTITALKVTLFGVRVLPEHITVSNEVYRLSPFKPTLSVCGRCGTIGHSKGKCHSTTPRCVRCSGTNHKAENCTKTRKCCNCGANHSATYRGCISVITHTNAHRIKNQAYMPYHQALVLAIKDTSASTSHAQSTLHTHSTHSTQNQYRSKGELSSKRRPPLLPTPSSRLTHKPHTRQEYDLYTHDTHYQPNLHKPPSYPNRAFPPRQSQFRTLHPATASEQQIKKVQGTKIIQPMELASNHTYWKPSTNINNANQLHQHISSDERAPNVNNTHFIHNDHNMTVAQQPKNTRTNKLSGSAHSNTCLRQTPNWDHLPNESASTQLTNSYVSQVAKDISTREKCIVKVVEAFQQLCNTLPYLPREQWGHSIAAMTLRLLLNDNGCNSSTAPLLLSHEFVNLGDYFSYLLMQ